MLERPAIDTVYYCKPRLSVNALRRIEVAPCGHWLHDASHTGWYGGTRIVSALGWPRGCGLVYTWSIAMLERHAIDTV
jgi:hypothetical protein